MVKKLVTTSLPSMIFMFVLIAVVRIGYDKTIILWILEGSDIDTLDTVKAMQLNSVWNYD